MMVENDEALMTNDETMTKHEQRTIVLWPPHPFGPSSFGFPSSFVIRISSFLRVAHRSRQLLHKRAHRLGELKCSVLQVTRFSAVFHFWKLGFEVYLGFGAWDLEFAGATPSSILDLGFDSFIWDLELGIWSLRRLPPAALRPPDRPP